MAGIKWQPPVGGVSYKATGKTMQADWDPREKLLQEKKFLEQQRRLFTERIQYLNRQLGYTLLPPGRLKYYVGSPMALRNGWAKETLEEAEDHAMELIEEKGEDQFIVQIIKVYKKPEDI